MLPTISPIDPAVPPFRVLVLCSGNVCRSPMFEVLLGHAASDAGVAAQVTSSGFLTADRPASPEVVELMAERGLDASAHRSRMTTPEMLAEADLVVAMAAEHLRNAVVLVPDVFGRTFLLRELVGAMAAAGGRRADEPIDAYLGRLFDDRNMKQYLRVNPDADVADPMGHRMKVYRATAIDLEALATQLVHGLWPDQAANPVTPVTPVDPVDLAG